MLDELLAACAWKLTASPASISRRVVAMALALSTVSAMEMPTPVLPDLVSPSALVWLVPASLASTVSLPLMASSSPLPIEASAELFRMAMATTGVTAVSPDEPCFACVVSL